MQETNEDNHLIKQKDNNLLSGRNNAPTSKHDTLLLNKFNVIYFNTNTS